MSLARIASTYLLTTVFFLAVDQVLSLLVGFVLGIGR